MKRKGLLTVLAVTGVAATTLALAGKTSLTQGSESITDPNAAKIHMIAAIAIAESATRGRAVQAELETDEERLAYEIEVLVDRAVKKIMVDATSGEVLPAKQDASKAARADEANAGEEHEG